MLDLHGHTVHTAWRRFREYTERCYRAGNKKIIVITGHGIMGQEFPGWCAADPYVSSVSRLDPNKGAWTVTLKISSVSKKKNTAANFSSLVDLYKYYNNY